MTDAPEARLWRNGSTATPKTQLGTVKSTSSIAAPTGIAVFWERLRPYTTAEPCCMCQGAILWAEVPEVVYGTSIRTLQQLGWQQIDLAFAQVERRTNSAQCRLIGDVLAAESDELSRRATIGKGERFA